MRYSPYSFSKIATYAQCPKKFWFIYLSKLPKRKIFSEHLYKGKVVHALLEHIRGDNQITRDVIETCVRANPFDKDPEIKMVQTDLLKESIQIVQHYQNSLFETSKGYLKSKANTEIEVSYDVNFKLTDYWDKSSFYRGYVDLQILDDPIVDLHLVDWKTGKLVQPQWQNYQQLINYAIYFFMTDSSINTIKISYVYVQHCQENSLMLKREYLPQYLKSFLEVIKKLEDDSEFERNPSKLCDWCDFRELCKSDQF